MLFKKTFTLLLLMLFAFSPSSVFTRDGKGRGRDVSKHDKKHERRAVDPGHGNIKHNGMDTNNNGVITRNEWRGNENSFRKHDRNGDGVLSGDELTPGARRDDKGERHEKRFRDADHNNDGIITRDEWHADARAFERLDLNRDGRISRDEFFRSKQ